jgi:hypothetical protein
MKFIRKSEGTKIIAYRLPDVGDKVVDKDGNEGYCSGIFEFYNGLIYEISDGENTAGVNESVFEQGILIVKH